MLSGCKAITIGRNEEQTRFLVKLAQKCGFTLIENAMTGDMPSPRTLVAFVLVHYGVGEALLDTVTRTIRGGDRQVRFSPIVVIADDCPFETVLRYVHIGVDDVVSLPEKKEVLIQRLGTQLWAEHVYVETADYFGPDRRRLELDSANDRRMGPSGHARFTIQRLPDIGTRIVRHQIFAAPNFAPKVHLAG